MIQCPKCNKNMNSIKDTWNKTIPSYVLCRDCMKIYKLNTKLVG